jgi:hypothetical protein
VHDFNEANVRALATTGKAIIFTCTDGHMLRSPNALLQIPLKNRNFGQ